MLFTGTYEHTIDSKCRLAIPAEIRDRLAESEDGRALYVCMGEKRTVCLYTRPDFERIAEQLDQSGVDPDELLEYEQALYSMARLVEIDKQGRVRLPEYLLRQAGLGSEVVLVGVKDHMEIHDRKAWQSYQQKLMKNLDVVFRNPRRLMKGPRNKDGRRFTDEPQ